MLWVGLVAAKPNPDFGSVEEHHHGEHGEHDEHGDHAHHEDHADHDENADEAADAAGAEEEASTKEAEAPKEEEAEAPAGPPEKKCELVRSLTATSAECFLEPECEEKCTQRTKQVNRKVL